MKIKWHFEIKWQYVAASIVGLTGAFFGGIYGSLAAGFAGDAYWTSDSMGLLYGGIVISGLLIGTSIWVCGRRRLKTEQGVTPGA